MSGGAVDEKCLRCGRRCQVDRGTRDKLSGWCMECLNGPLLGYAGQVATGSERMK